MWIARTVQALREQRSRMTRRVALAPTMGALHDGHVALIERARSIADHVIVSIFVNPTQFAPGEDFDRYPRPIDDDLAKCKRIGVDGVFAPEVIEMYPRDQVACRIDVPAITQTLEGERRPGHFQGVCRVVAKLFNMAEPDVACFGRKDYQQLKVIEAMTRDLALPIDIEPVPTVREDDGLAMSSRNRYLDAAGRKHALGLHKALLEAQRLIEGGELEPAVVESAMTQVMTANHVDVDYAVVRHPQTLGTLDVIEPTLTRGVVALVAGRVGDVRLIDNMVIGQT